MRGENMIEATTILSVLSAIMKTYNIYKSISKMLIDEMTSFLARISELEFKSAILALRESVHSQDKRREIETAINHLRLAIEKAESCLMVINIASMIAFCYKLLGESKLMNVYKEKAVRAFEQWLDHDLVILKAAKLGMESEHSLIFAASNGVRFAKTNPYGILKKITIESKLIQVGLDPYSIKESIGYNWDPIPYSTSGVDKDVKLILEAKKKFRESLDKYYSSF